MKNILIWIVVLLIAGGGLYYFFIRGDEPASDTQGERVEVVGEGETDEAATEEMGREPSEIIGESAGGRDITAYHYGEGESELLFVGGIHGGYSWNTALVAYELMDYLEGNPNIIPSGVMVTVVPVLNPDGLFETVGTADRFTEGDVPSGEGATIPGRFNANGVDLNRNFDCDWQSTGTWQSREVDGGSAAFSEPESQALRDYVEAHRPRAAVVWYSAAGGVFASDCHGGVLPETIEITNLYADASGYRAYESFDFYTITGDMVNWLAKEGIPAISVLLSTHDDVEWEENRAGVEALLEHYAN